jgi:hypothetical protein
MRRIAGVGKRRLSGIVASFVMAAALGGCGELGLLPHSTDVKNSGFKTYKDVEDAYAAIAPGQTQNADLVRIGFDSSESPNVEALSYLGVIERFIPRDSIRFDNLDPVVQQCIEERERCSGYVFRPERLHQERLGNWFLDVLGFQRTFVNYGWSAEVVLLVMDGHVVYKVMSGRPHIEDFHHNVQPLGPFQDLSGVVLGSASSATSFKY